MLQKQQIPGPSLSRLPSKMQRTKEALDENVRVFDKAVLVQNVLRLLSGMQLLCRRTKHLRMQRPHL